MPEPGLAGGIGGQTLDPQECFNKALVTMAALRPPTETATLKRYTTAKLQQLRAVCSLLVAGMATTLPVLHKNLLTEGRRSEYHERR
jgi:hypothetical protein